MQYHFAWPIDDSLLFLIFIFFDFNCLRPFFSSIFCCFCYYFFQFSFAVFIQLFYPYMEMCRLCFLYSKIYLNFLLYIYMVYVYTFFVRWKKWKRRRAFLYIFRCDSFFQMLVCALFFTFYLLFFYIICIQNVFYGIYSITFFPLYGSHPVCIWMNVFVFNCISCLRIIIWIHNSV